MLEATLSTLGNVLLTAEGCEAPVLGNDDLLAARELVLRSAEGFDGGGSVWFSCKISDCGRRYDLRMRILTGITGANTQEDLANVDASYKTVWLA
jgi:hypothetical protein